MQNIGNFHRTIQDLVKMHLCAIEARVGSRKAAALAYCYHGLLHNNFRLSKGLLCLTFDLALLQCILLSRMVK